jgi:amino acid transporter
MTLLIRSTTFPSNGGYVTWVVRGLGPVLGFTNMCNCVASAVRLPAFEIWQSTSLHHYFRLLTQVLNLPLYPVLFASYVQQLFPSISTGYSKRNIC